MSNDALKLSGQGIDIELPIMEGSVGPKVVDIRKLYAQTGMFTFDPGFTATASCESQITYIDGDLGELQYRGAQTVKNCPSATVHWV